jgi:hypothetical protein
VVNALAVFGGKLYVGGGFTTLGGGIPSANYIAAWDGSTWTTLPSGSSNGLASGGRSPPGVSALAVFGNPSARIGLPLTSSPAFANRAIDLCNPGDPICSDGDNVPAHRSYGPDGTAYQAAVFVANRI